jgi:hypothetical protein
MSEKLPPLEQPVRPQQPPRRRDGLPRWAKGLAVAAAALVLAGSFVGVGMAVTSTSAPGMSGDSMTPTAFGSAGVGGATSDGTMDDGSMSHGSTPDVSTSANPSTGKRGALNSARRAWAHKYGVERSSMPNLAPVTAGTPQQQSAARSLLVATEQATAPYGNLATAKAAGFDLQASLAQAEKKHPQLATTIARSDAGAMPRSGMLPMLHVGNTANRGDGKVLDPNAPETLMYEYLGHGDWKLIGVMYVANESFPDAPPDPGGEIMRWHYHNKSGGQSLMMHLFFVDDLAHAYAAEMS